MPYDIIPGVDGNSDFPPAIRAALAKSAELKYLIVPMTTTQRNNLTALEKWDGRIIANTTTDRLNRYDAGTDSWAVLAETTETDVPYWRGKATAIQSIATGNNTGMGLAWLSSGGGFSGSGSSSPGNAPKTGLYQVSARARWSGSSAGTTRKLGVFVNNAGVEGAWVVMPPSGNGVLMGISCVVAANAGQPILPVVFHDAGVNLDLNINGVDRSAAEVVYMGPL